MRGDVQVIFTARVLMSAARALASVVAPIYLAIEGFNAFTLGLLFLVVALVSAAFSSAIGLASDRVGRKVFLVVVPLIAAGAAVAFALTRDTAVLVAAAALGSFGRGSGAGAGAVGPYQPAESAYVTGAVLASKRNSAFGRLSFGSSIGALAGGLLALLVSTDHLDKVSALAAFRPAFLAAAGLAAAAGLVALALHEKRPAHRPEQKRRTIHFPRRSKPLLYRLWLTNGVNGIAIGMFGPFVTFWLYRRYGVSAGEIGVLFAVINLATAPATLSAAGLARRFGLVRTVTAVRVAQSLLLIPMVLSPTFVLAGGFYLIRMVVQRIGLPLRQSYSLGMADPDERSSVAALSNLPSQVAMAASPVLSGYLLESVSLELPFELAAVFQFANAVLFFVFFRHRPPEEEGAGVGSAGSTPGQHSDGEVARELAHSEPIAPSAVAATGEDVTVLPSQPAR